VSISRRIYEELMFAVSPPLPFLLTLFYASPRGSCGRIRAGRGIIFAVLPIQLCVRRKAAFNKSLIKGKQRGVSSSRVRRIFRSCARKTVLLSLPLFLSLSPSLSLSLSPGRSSKGLPGKPACRSAEEKREHAKGSQLPRTDSPAKKY